jgi:hypothetical protein
MAGAGQGEAVGGGPVEDSDGCLDVLSHDHGLVVSGRRAVDPAAEPAQQMPDRVAVQQVLLVGIVAVAMVRVIQRSSRTICSSRGSSVPVATKTVRRCSTALPAGRSSR